LPIGLVRVEGFGRKGEAAGAYRRALELAENQIEVTYLRRRLREVSEEDEAH